MICFGQEAERKVRLLCDSLIDFDDDGFAIVSEDAIKLYRNIYYHDDVLTGRDVADLAAEIYTYSSKDDLDSFAVLYKDSWYYTTSRKEGTGLGLKPAMICHTHTPEELTAIIRDLAYTCSSYPQEGCNYLDILEEDNPLHSIYCAYKMFVKTHWYKRVAYVRDVCRLFEGVNEGKKRLLKLSDSSMQIPVYGYVKGLRKPLMHDIASGWKANAVSLGDICDLAYFGDGEGYIPQSAVCERRLVDSILMAASVHLSGSEVYPIVKGWVDQAKNFYLAMTSLKEIRYLAPTSDVREYAKCCLRKLR